MTQNYRQKRFSRAARTYHHNSDMQKQIAECLMGILPEKFKAARILELGCGTGHLSRLLLGRFPLSAITLTDTSQDMLDVSQEILPIGGFSGGVDWRVLDGLACMGKSEFDLICSSTLVQWFPDISGHIKRVSEALKSGGYYLFSGFSQDNFTELNRLLSQAPFNKTRFPGHALAEVKSALTRFTLSPVIATEERKTRYYLSFKRFMQVLNLTGTSGRTDGLLSRGKLQLLEERYTAKYGLGEGIQATWRPWYVLAQKSNST